MIVIVVSGTDVVWCTPTSAKSSNPWLTQNENKHKHVPTYIHSNLNYFNGSEIKSLLRSFIVLLHGWIHIHFYYPPLWSAQFLYLTVVDSHCRFLLLLPFDVRVNLRVFVYSDNSSSNSNNNNNKMGINGLSTSDVVALFIVFISVLFSLLYINSSAAWVYLFSSKL